VKKVLVVDDDDVVRTFLRDVLQRLGLRVLEADDGEAALQVLAREPDIRLVILDLRMRRMHGEETLRGIRAMRPDLKVIISSAYLDAETERTLAGLGVKAFLRKPYPLMHLQETVRHLVEEI